MHSSLDSYGTLTESTDFNMADTDLQMTPFPPVHRIVFPQDCSGNPCSECSPPGGKLNGVWPIMCSMLNAYPEVRSEERRVFILQWCPKATTICFWAQAPSRVLFPLGLMILVSCIKYTCPRLFHGPVPAIARSSVASLLSCSMSCKTSLVYLRYLFQHSALALASTT